MSLPSMNLLDLTVSEIQPRQTFSRHPPAGSASICLSILKYLSIQAKFADIDNVGYNINIKTYHLTGTTIVFFIQIKYNI